VKLHGTNAGVLVYPDGKVRYTSRERLITPGNDNQGFACWASLHEEEVAGLATHDAIVTVFGEWCGPGIAGGTAVNKLSKKIFAVFAVRLSTDNVVDENDNDGQVIIDPEVIEGILPTIDGMYVIPWFNNAETFAVPWTSAEDVLQPIVERINDRVLEVEAKDPWMASAFGVEGIGEGLVFFPVSEEHTGSYHAMKDLFFKAKGEAHKNVKKAKPAQLDPSVAAGAQAFAEMVCTQARLEQGARAVAEGKLEFFPKNIGPFIGWILKDVEKETQLEREASGLDQKLVNNACTDYARKWYVTNMRKL
jgi:hypothetical protein